MRDGKHPPRVHGMVAGWWSTAAAVALPRRLKREGVDLSDCSSGGVIRNVKPPLTPGYQVQVAEAIRKGAEIPTAAVRLITEPKQAEEILRSGNADLVYL